MDLKMRDVSKMLRISMSTVRRWLSEGKIPAYKLGNQYRFSPMEIEAWVMQRKIHPEPPPTIAADEFIPPAPQGTNRYSLYRAIHKGAVWSDIEGSTKEEVIQEAMNRLSSEIDLDPELMTELLLDREQMMPTALNKGIAVPHTRDIMLQNRQDVVAVCFLKDPLPYGALDGEPVNTLFFLFAADDRRHLHLLAKIAHLASSDEARALFRARPNKLKVLQHIKDWESQLRSIE
jgi:PTS system nitrogen regulatory IIA component